MFVAVKPPRPRTTAAALLMLIGGCHDRRGGPAVDLRFGQGLQRFRRVDIGCFQRGRPPGGFFVLLGVVLIGFGIATLAAGRVLPIMIIGIVFAAFAVLVTITHLADYVDVTDTTSASLGPGIIVTMLGSAAALAGAIAGCATRRKWWPGMEPREATTSDAACTPGRLHSPEPHRRITTGQLRRCRRQRRCRDSRAPQTTIRSRSWR